VKCRKTEKSIEDQMKIFLVAKLTDTGAWSRFVGTILKHSKVLLFLNHRVITTLSVE